MSAPKPAPPAPSENVSHGRRTSFPALRHRDFRLVWAGQFVSVAGSQMQTVAINWHIYLLTKSSLALGAVGLVRVVPIILCSLVGGVVADVFDRKRLIIVTQLVLLSSAGLLSAVTAYGLRSVWPIYLLTALSAAATAFENPARQALLPMLVPAEDFTSAVSLGLISFNFATVVGPALAGLVLSIYGPAPVYAANAVSFIAVITAMLLIRASGRVISTESGAARVSFAALKEGLGFVRHTPIIVQTMTLDFIATFFASATALLPIFAAEILHVGARGLGLLAAAPAMGSVIAGFSMARLGTPRKQGFILLAAIGVYGLATIAFGLSKVFWLSLIMLAMIGASDTVSTVLRQTIRQLSTPDYLRGRMTSINMIFFMGGPQLGEMEAGALASVLGASLSVVTGGVGCLVAVLVAALMARRLRSYEGTMKAR
ncbi:MAG TPA: MFS transporter [Pyrinomonadaceae bacterium]|nr:MFS transporter [Pyrinomonadaceae bacterium]